MAATAPNAGRSWADVITSRPHLTAKALRALGRPVPHDVPDDECVVLTMKDPR